VVAWLSLFHFSASLQGLENTDTMSRYWIDGTAGNQCLPFTGVL
jgi:hypothetical protein